jgi:kynurenine formamidase
MAEHSGTHIDALCHQAEELKLFGGVPVTPQLQTPLGFGQLGVDTISPIVRRGVLIDLVARRGAPVGVGEEVQLEELEATAAEQGVIVGKGDVALVRTGNSTRWANAKEYLSGCGMSRTVSEWMAARGVFAVGADLVAWDLPGPVDPVIGSSLPGHLILLVRSGIHILENLDLERLGGDSVREFLFVCLPLKFSGGTGSPIRPVAIVPG